MAKSSMTNSLHQEMQKSGICEVPCDKCEGSHQSLPNWYLSLKEIEENSPSRRDGIDLKTETSLRISYCTFLQDLGLRLKLPQLTIATATVFCHRFYLRQSHAKNDWMIIATVCMYLASKVEETPCPLKDVIPASYEVIHKGDSSSVQKIKQEELYEQQKGLLILGERLVLTTLAFDVTVNHPYKPLVEALKKLKVAQNALAQVAWNFVNDGLRTSLSLQYKPHHIAASAIYLAAKFLNVKLPSDGDKIWWRGLDVSSWQLKDINNQIMELYNQEHFARPSLANVVEGNIGVGLKDSVAMPSTITYNSIPRDGHSEILDVTEINKEDYSIPPAETRVLPHNTRTDRSDDVEVMGYSNYVVMNDNVAAVQARKLKDESSFKSSSTDSKSLRCDKKNVPAEIDAVRDTVRVEVTIVKRRNFENNAVWRNEPISKIDLIERNDEVAVVQLRELRDGNSLLKSSSTDIQSLSCDKKDFFTKIDTARVEAAPVKWEKFANDAEPISEVDLIKRNGKVAAVQSREIKDENSPLKSSSTDSQCQCLRCDKKDVLSKIDRVIVEAAILKRRKFVNDAEPISEVDLIKRNDKVAAVHPREPKDENSLFKSSSTNSQSLRCDKKDVLSNINLVKVEAATVKREDFSSDAEPISEVDKKDVLSKIDRVRVEAATLKSRKFTSDADPISKVNLVKRNDKIAAVQPRDLEDKNSLLKSNSTNTRSLRCDKKDFLAKIYTVKVESATVKKRKFPSDAEPISKVDKEGFLSKIDRVRVEAATVKRRKFANEAEPISEVDLVKRNDKIAALQPRDLKDENSLLRSISTDSQSLRCDKDVLSKIDRVKVEAATVKKEKFSSDAELISKVDKEDVLSKINTVSVEAAIAKKRRLQNDALGWNEPNSKVDITEKNDKVEAGQPRELKDENSWFRPSSTDSQSLRCHKKDVLSKIDTVGVEAAIVKRREFQNDKVRRSEPISKVDLIERKLETRIQLAVEDVKIKPDMPLRILQQALKYWDSGSRFTRQLGTGSVQNSEAGRFSFPGHETSNQRRMDTRRKWRGTGHQRFFHRQEAIGRGRWKLFDLRNTRNRNI